MPTQLKIAFLAGCGLTQREIGYKTNTSLGTVNKYLHIKGSDEFINTKFDFKKQLKYHFVLYKTLQNPFITNSLISKNSQNFEFSMSESTVSRISKDLKIKSKFQKPKEKLTAKQKNKSHKIM